jgi:dephospho-CoA kinase
MLIMVCGFSGAGKSTAIENLCKASGGAPIYFGEVILNEIVRRGLVRSPDVERSVRKELRDVHGPAFLAAAATPKIVELLAQGRDVFIDAVFCPEELDHLRDAGRANPTALLMIEANFATRSGRLARREQRPCSEEQLRERDRHERANLRIDDVFERADAAVANERTLHDFEVALRAWWTSASSR